MRIEPISSVGSDFYVSQIYLQKSLCRKKRKDSSILIRPFPELLAEAIEKCRAEEEFEAYIHSAPKIESMENFISKQIELCRTQFLRLNCLLYKVENVVNTESH